MDNTKFLEQIIERDRFEFIGPEFLRLRRPVTVKILIVVDGGISFSQTGFGLGLLLDTLREPAYDYVRFNIELATRNGSTPSENPDAGPYSTRYSGFRFDQTNADDDLIINQYDQLWLFGFAPGNDAGPDSNIESDYRKLTELELIHLTGWMNTHQGGLLAMGDHDYLGATMCWKIPRIRHMRRWTNAQNVPPIGGFNNPDTHLRHDTNQPRTPGQLAGSAVIPFGAQGDSKPQTIRPRQYYIGRGLIYRANYQPHPILCSRRYGVIDILPDHPHEGWVYEDHEIDPNASYSWSEGGHSISGDDFPEVGGHREMPEVIAWARTTPNPPYLLAKGASPQKEFGVIGAYDGHQANVGRVATDATWHHWFSENLVGMKADNSTDHYEMIQDYFRNVAVWLARPAQQSQMLSVATWNSLFTVQAFQELGPRLSPFIIGPNAQDVLGRRVSKCTYRRWIWDFILPELYPWWRRRLLDPVCLSCPPFEMLEAAALAVVVEELLPLRDESIDKNLSDKKLEQMVDKAFQKAIKRAAPDLLKELDKEYSREAKELAGLAKKVKGTDIKHHCD